MNNLTRSKAIQIWFAAVALLLAAAVTLGSSLAFSTWAVILGLAVVPAVLMFALWPGAPTRSMKDLLYESKRTR